MLGTEEQTAQKSGQITDKLETTNYGQLKATSRERGLALGQIVQEGVCDFIPLNNNNLA